MHWRHPDIPGLSLCGLRTRYVTALKKRVTCVACKAAHASRPLAEKHRNNASSPWHPVPVLISELLHHIHARRPLEEARILSLGLAELLEIHPLPFWLRLEDKPLKEILAMCLEHGRNRAGRITPTPPASASPLARERPSPPCRTSCPSLD